MKTFKDFFKKLFGQDPRIDRRIDSKYVFWVVESADKACPDAKKFQTIAPYVHHSKETLEMVNQYGKLSQVYCESLVKQFGDNIPLEIEQAIINLRSSNLIYYLTNAGHAWSVEAGALMRQKHPKPYQYNVKHKLAPKNALIFLADKEFFNWYQAKQRIPEGILYNFKARGYITRCADLWCIATLDDSSSIEFNTNDNRWRITGLGKQQAEIYRQQKAN